jgi:hypothetical protein
MTEKKRSSPAKAQGPLRRAEHHLEEAVKDAVAEVENRVIIAGQAADESTSSEVNLLSAVEVAINPPHEKTRAKPAAKRRGGRPSS